MSRQKRVEYENAIYHVVAKGNRGSKIVEDDADRERFVDTLAELIENMHWDLYAWAVLDEQYHLVFRTPDADLVEGMTWFQNTLTKRHNGRHKTIGHLFAGRYQTTLVEEGEYLSDLIHYVNLRSVRVKELLFTKESVAAHRWGSLKDYQLPPSGRSSFINAEAGFSSLGVPDTKKGRDRLWEQSKALEGGIERKVQDNIRSGWVLGSEDFLAEVSGMVELSKEDIKNGYGGAQLRGLSEIKAKEIIEDQLVKYELSSKELAELPKSDWRKAAIAIELRDQTTVNAAWIAKELVMGTASSLSRAIQNYRFNMEESSEGVSEDFGYEKLAVNLL